LPLEGVARKTLAEPGMGPDGDHPHAPLIHTTECGEIRGRAVGSCDHEIGPVDTPPDLPAIDGTVDTWEELRVTEGEQVEDGNDCRELARKVSR
jgi:hypothetical protein